MKVFFLVSSKRFVSRIHSNHSYTDKPVTVVREIQIIASGLFPTDCRFLVRQLSVIRRPEYFVIVEGLVLLSMSTKIRTKSSNINFILSGYLIHLLRKFSGKGLEIIR